MSTYNPTVSTQPLQESYGYDQLNRITAHASNAGHASSYSYDPNGNILKLSRTSASGSIDQLDYRYEKIGTNSYVRNRNRLRKVADGSGNDAGLPTGQLEDNYVYDELGELSSDQKANVTSIEWNVYGKVKKVNKTAASTDLEFLYDATGNRIAKIVKPMASKADNTTWQYTWYVRDAQGNVMATYQQNAGSTQLAEHHIYGSSRLGVARYTATPVISATATNQDNTGDKAYELTDHLGNVRVVLSDRQENVSGTVKSEIFSANDYWPFGMSMGDRSFTTGITGLGGYRYGFNGKEKASEISEGDYDYGFRIYDSRLCRFLSVDPLRKTYPWYTPYQFAGNKPIFNIDIDGLEDTPNKYYALSLSYSDSKFVFGVGAQFGIGLNSSFVTNLSASDLKSISLSSYFNLNGLVTTGTTFYPANKKIVFFANRDQTSQTVDINEQKQYGPFSLPTYPVSNTDVPGGNEKFGQALNNENTTVTTTGAEGSLLVIDPTKKTIAASTGGASLELFSDLSLNLKLPTPTTISQTPDEKVVNAIDEANKNAQPTKYIGKYDISTLGKFKAAFLDLGNKKTTISKLR